ncbi:MAG: hypothetical protein GY866_19050 [Proteobacteria bacterium]|nr:hypothetical protein [Pseudomonadota bacterium]
MLKRIIRKRTSFEKAEWEQVRELMPRRRATRGIQYEALEYLFDHLYEKVSEEELREHFLKVKGHLQQKGDPVKSAINLAIKELQRLSKPTFDLIKIQEASLVGKTRRYVQLNFTGFDSVINYEQFRSYLEDVLSDEKLPILRSIFNIPPNLEPMIFPGIKRQWLRQLQAHALISSADQMDDQDKKTNYYFIPESQGNQSFLLLYGHETSELPFLAFVSDVASVASLNDSQYMVYRGEEKLAKLEFLHQIWVTQKAVALDSDEATDLWDEANRLSEGIKEKNSVLDEKTLFRGLLAQRVRENWKQFQENSH